MIGSIRFAGDFSPWLVFGIVAVAVLAVCWLYAKEAKSLASPYNVLLPALRSSAVAFTILILAGPIWHKRQVIGTLGRVVFAVDTSGSMSVSDSGEASSTPDRLGRATSLLLGEEARPGWLEQLQETHEVDVIGFSAGQPTMLWSSRGEDPPPNAFEIAANGERTDLSSGIQATMDSMDADSDDESVGVDSSKGELVIFSDGRDNIGESAVDLAKRLGSQSMTIHSVGMGSQDEPADVGIVNIVRPESVASDGRLSGSLVLKQFGMTGKPLSVRIESAGETVWQKTITTAGDGLQNVPFEFDVDPIVKAIQNVAERGVRRGTVVMDLRSVVEPLDGDSAGDNNSKSFRVAANTRDRGLLIVDGSSRWETRYLRNVFERDPAWSVNTVLFGPGTSTPKIVRGKEDGQFPNTREEMARYDAIILGEIHSEQITEADTRNLREFVTRGGGLIVIDGQYGNLRPLINQSLADLIPVKYSSGQEYATTTRILPTKMGLEHPVLNLVGASDRLAEFWEQIPAPKRVANVQPQEGAEVWGHAVGNDSVRYPWLVTRLFGAGRVFYFSAAQSWRWRYKVADRFHGRFWNQLLAAVMQPPYSASDQYVAIGSDKIEYSPGAAATIRARLHDTAGKPVGDATVDALLIADNRVVATVPLSVEDPARGTYQGRTGPLTAGAYRIRIRASGFDESALQASTPIWVGSVESVEKRRVGLDKNALTQISEAAGGVYVHESSADKLLEQIKPLSSGRVIESDILMWQSFWWFWVIIALLAVEWWLRKRAGLV